MSKSLYLECFSGISGDMFVATMLDLGVSEENLLKILNNINIDGFKIEIKRKFKSGIDVCDFDVILDKEHENYDHDMGYLHGHSHDIEEHHNEHIHGDEHKPNEIHLHEHIHHEHSQAEPHLHAHHHEHRSFKDILALIEKMDIDGKIKNLAIKIFEIIARAEAKAHNKSVEEVHFHEVGAIDSIVDIIAAAYCMYELNVEDVIVPILYEGYGSIRCQHGILPIPVPATLNIISENNIKIKQGICEGELITPTGAAIVAAIKTKDILPNDFKILKVGLGGGKREYASTGILRAMLIESDEVEKDIVYKIESNIDDCSGEVLGYVMDKLLHSGALDVNYSPIFMKKNRPAYQLNVIVAKNKLEEIKSIIFENTSTIGMRIYETKRCKLERKNISIDTSLGRVELKECILPSGTKRAYPEYKSVVEICQKFNLSYLEVYNKIMGAYNDRF